MMKAVVAIATVGAVGAGLISQGYAGSQRDLSSLCPGGQGVYAGAAAPEAVRAFERWRGSPVGCAEDFLSSQSWDDIAAPVWWLARWEPDRSHHHLVLSVPLLPDSGADMDSGAQGRYNAYFRALAAVLVQHHLADTTIRLGWEFNGGGNFAWTLLPDGGPDGTATSANFISYWRHVVTTMRSVPGADFTFDWTVNNGSNGIPAETAYPGDEYVDIIGVDAYDTVWGPYGSEVRNPAQRWRIVSEDPRGLNWWAAFARSHGKMLSVPEWGISNGDHGGGDNPYYVRHMLTWTAANNAVYTIYFDHARSRLSLNHFPLSADAYRGRARGSGTPPGVPEPRAGPGSFLRQPVGLRVAGCGDDALAARRSDPRE